MSPLQRPRQQQSIPATGDPTVQLLMSFLSFHVFRSLRYLMRLFPWSVYCTVHFVFTVNSHTWKYVPQDVSVPLSRFRSDKFILWSNPSFFMISFTHECNGRAMSHSRFSPPRTGAGDLQPWPWEMKWHKTTYEPKRLGVVMSWATASCRLPPNWPMDLGFQLLTFVWWLELRRLSLSRPVRGIGTS